MKHTITVVLIAFVFLSSACKTEMQVPNPELKKIFSKWQWVSTSGGFAGKNSTPSNAGYDLRIEFKSNGMFVRYKDSTLIDNKKFSFSQDTSIQNHNKPLWVVCFTDGSPKMAVSFSGNDTLMLDEQTYDGYRNIYARIK